MTDRLVDMTCADFADALAAACPVPGGGGVAAYAGALGVALASMAGGFTIGKERYADVEPQVRELLDECEAMRLRLVELVDGDARAYGALNAAFKMDRDDPERPAIVHKALIEAAQVPLETMEAACRTIQILERMGDVCSRLLIADIGCGANLCRAALGAASLSVYANTCSLKDRALAADLEERAQLMLDEYLRRADRLAARVAGILKGEC